MAQTAYGSIPDAELQVPQFSILPAIPLSVVAEKNLPSVLTPSLAYFAGFFFGDGGLKDIERSFMVTKRREYKMIIADEFELQIRTVQSLYQDLFGKLPPLRFERLSKGEHTVYINPTSKAVYLFLTRTFELPCGPKTSFLSIPTIIWNAPRELQQWFLRGLFDAEGDTRAIEKGFTSAPRIKLRMKCIPFVKQVKQLFESSFGIKMNGPYLDKNGASAYVQVERFLDIMALSQQSLFLHPIKRWRLEQTAKMLAARSNTF